MSSLSLKYAKLDQEAKAKVAAAKKEAPKKEETK